MMILLYSEHWVMTYNDYLLTPEIVVAFRIFFKNVLFLSGNNF